ncbi:MAG TPA: type IV toxin-antitoxin system AbiEi family antitoxin domain-containing protein [Solirubrobacterales bacterium]|nr:type IV toxin-antitoxin system AbiEi family antitoxin domain-containing protein [Solirubrobacterales bacterium]
MGAVASRQQGLVTRGQLRQLGLSDNAVSKAIERGWLHPVFHGVHSVGHRHLTESTRLLAATLACGRGAVISHGTAAWLFGLVEAKPEAIDVIAPVEAGRKIDGIRRRFVPPPEDSEVWSRGGVPVTSPARTIVDYAGISSTAGIGEVIEQAAVLRLLDVDAIDRVLDGPRRRGSGRLQRIIAPWRRYRSGITIRSRMEAKLLPLLSEAALPIPETNVRVRVGAKSYEFDFLWRGRRVVVETDGGRFHDNPAAGDRDSERNHALARAGYRIARFGWQELRDRPTVCMEELRTLLYR